MLIRIIIMLVLLVTGILVYKLFLHSKKLHKFIDGLSNEDNAEQILLKEKENQKNALKEIEKSKKNIGKQLKNIEKLSKTLKNIEELNNK